MDFNSNPQNDMDYEKKSKPRRSWFDDNTKPVTFQIAVENIEPCKESNKLEVSDMETIVLSAFSNPPRLDFGTVKVGLKKTCLLNLHNPHDYAQNVKIQKFPSKKGFSTETMTVMVQPESTYPMYINWEPIEPGNCRELIMCLVEGAYRVQAYLLGCCPEPQKPKKQMKGIKSLKKPTNMIGRPQKNPSNSRSQDVNPSKSNKLVQNIPAKESRQPLQPKNAINPRKSEAKEVIITKPKNTEQRPKGLSCNDRILKKSQNSNKENDPRMTVRLSKPKVLPQLGEFPNKYGEYKNIQMDDTEVVETLLETYITTETDVIETEQFEVRKFYINNDPNVINKHKNTYKNIERKIMPFSDKPEQPSPRRETYISSNINKTYSQLKSDEKNLASDEIKVITMHEIVDCVEEEFVVTKSVVSSETEKCKTYSIDKELSIHTSESQQSKKLYTAASRLVKNDQDILDSPLRRTTFIKDDPSLPITPVRRETFFKETTDLPNTPVINSPDSLDSSLGGASSPRSLCRMGLSSLRKRNKSVSPPRSKTPLTHFNDDSQVYSKPVIDESVAGLTPLRRHGTYTKLDSSISPKPQISHTAESSPRAHYEATDDLDDLPFTSDNDGAFSLAVSKSKREPKKLSIISERSERDRQSVLSTYSIDCDKRDVYNDKPDVYNEHCGSPYSSKYATAYTTPYESPALSDKEEFEDSLSFVQGEHSAANNTVLENSQLMASLLRDKLEKVVSFDGTPPVKLVEEKKLETSQLVNDTFANLLVEPKNNKNEDAEIGEFSKDSEFSSHVSIDTFNESVKYHSKKESMGNTSQRDSLAKLLGSSDANYEMNITKNVQNSSISVLLGTPVMQDLRGAKTFSADDSIAHLLETPGMKYVDPVPVYEDVKVVESETTKKTPSPKNVSRFSIMSQNERSPSIYGNPFSDEPIEVSTLGFPNESFLDREKINLGMFKSLKKQKASLKREEPSNPTKVKKCDYFQQNNKSYDVDHGYDENGKVRKLPLREMTKNISEDCKQENIKATETVPKEIKQRLSSTPKAQTPELMQYENTESHEILVQTPSPIIGRRVSRDTVTKSHSSVLSLTDLKESQVKKGLFQYKSENESHRVASSSFIDSPLTLGDLNESFPFEVSTKNKTFSTDFKDESISYMEEVNARTVNTLTIPKDKPSVGLPGIPETTESETEGQISKQYFTYLQVPEERQISTMTVTKSKPAVLEKESDESKIMSRKQLFDSKNVNEIKDSKKKLTNTHVNKETGIAYTVDGSKYGVPGIKQHKTIENFRTHGKASDDFSLRKECNLKKTRRSVAVMQTTGMDGNNQSLKKDKFNKNELLKVSPQKRDHSVDKSQGTRKRFRSEQMKQPAKVNQNRRLSGAEGIQCKTQNSTLSLRKQAALTSIANSSTISTNKRTGKTGTIKGLAKGKLTLMKQPKSQDFYIYSKLMLKKQGKKAGIPKHPLPFAAKNVYYDEKWMEKEERGFVKWLNFILTPPDFYFDARKPKKIDAGQLFLETNQYSITMAPTKEVLSFKAYSVKRKLNRLRRSACSLFQTDKFVTVQSKLEREIECGRLAIRKDRLIFADLGLKQKILEMLLSYNPLWLRIGLETVYGEIVSVDNTTDILGLSRFIVQRFLGNPEIAMEYAHPTVPHLYKDGYYDSLGQFTLKKYLMIVMFLDHAKRSRLIQEDPCLFCKDSEFKASKDLLFSFSRDFLAGEGDLVKHLSFLGYKVSHSQTALEEVDYAVSNLAVDLRDGLRVTRVVSLLTEDWKILESLRCPAISRLQKIHNVGVALKSLTGRGVDLSGAKGGNIDARDIVEGHREKTLHLLWRIIFNFQVEQVIDLAKLQEEIAFLKKNFSTKKQQEALLNDLDPDMLGLPREPKESMEPSDVYFNSEKLSLLLRWCRAVCAYFDIKVDNFTVSFSDGRVLCALLHYYHPDLLTWKDINVETTQTYMGEKEPDSSFHSDDSFSFDTFNVSSFPNVNSPAYEQLLKNERENFKTLYEKVSELGGIPLMLRTTDMSATIPDEKVVITYVSYLCARLLDIRTESRAARIIQHAWRQYMIKRHKCSLQDRIKAAIIIQKCVKHFLRKKQNAKENGAALKIQCCFRRYQAKKMLLDFKYKASEEKYTAAALVIQYHMRRFLIKLQQQRRHKSAIVIQTFVRRYQAMKSYQTLRNCASFLQAKWRANKECKKSRFEYWKACQNVIKVQSYVKRWLSMRLVKKHRAATKIQSLYRMYSDRRKFVNMLTSIVKIQALVKSYQTRKRYLLLCSAACKIQTLFRAKTNGRKQRIQYSSLQKATIKIQSYIRRFLAQKYITKLRAVIKLQACFKGYQERRKYRQMRKAAALIQNNFRAIQQGKSQCQKYKKIKAGVLVTQACIRGYLARKQIQHKLAAVRVLQRSYRSYKCRCSFLKLRQAVVNVQRLYKTNKLMTSHVKKYQTTRKAVIKLQSIFRMFVVWKSYQSYKRSVIFVQSLVRRNIAFKAYNHQRRAVHTLQRYFRSYNLMKKERKRFCEDRSNMIKVQSIVKMHYALIKYRKMKKCIVHIQSLVRRNIARERYKAMRTAVTLLQQKFRGYLHMQKTKEYFQMYRANIIKVQSIVRRHQAMKAYNQTRGAVISMQSLVRMKLVKSHYLALKGASVSIQRFYRSYVHMKNCHNNFNQKRKAAIKIQSCFRMQLAKRRYKKQLQRIIYLQSLVKCKIAQQRFGIEKKAAVCIQRTWRAYSIMLFNQKEMLRKISACITLQKYYRGYITRKNYCFMKFGFIQLQSCIRCKQQKRKFCELKSAAITIQQKWQVTLKARQEAKKYKVIKSGFTALQALHRGRKERERYVYFISCITKLQSLVRCIIAKRKYHELMKAAIVIQRRFRAVQTGAKLQKNFTETKSACIKIQNTWRSCCARKKYLAMRQAVKQLQAFVRGYLQRKKYMRMKKAAVVLQNRYRATIAARKERNSFIFLREATVIIQSCYRKWKCENNYIIMQRGFVHLQTLYRVRLQQRQFLTQRLAAFTIQQWWRSRKLMKEQQLRYTMLKRHAVVLQTTFRAYKARKQFKTMKAGFSKLQAMYRGNLQRLQFLKLKRAALTLQYRLRAALVAKKQRRNYLYTIVRVVTAQTIVRRNIAVKNYNTMKRGFTRLQSFCRMRIQCKKYKQNKLAALTIQKNWRATLAFRNQCHAAIKIQNAWRGFSARNELAKLKRYHELKRLAATVILQYHTKKYLLKKKSAEHYRQKVNSIIKLQSYVRMYIAKQKVKTLKAVVRIQKQFRGFIARQQFKRMYSSIIQCQALCRMFVSRRKYMKLKKVVKILQERRRAQIMGRECRQEIFNVQQSAIKIQSCYKCYRTRKQYLIMQKGFTQFQILTKKYLYRKHYERVSSAACIIQLWWRNIKLFHIEKNLYIHKKKQVKVIQKAFRRYIQTKRRSDNAATAIQKVWRGYVVCKRVAKLHLAVRTIQKKFRTCRKEIFNKKKEVSSLKIQSVIRMYTVRKKFLHTRKAVILSQALWRGRKVRKELKDVRIKKIRDRIERANNNATEEKTLASRTISALDFLLKCKDLGTVLGALMDLDVVTKLLPECCERLVEANAVHVLYRIIQGSNRSIPHQELIKYAVSTLLNLAKYDKTAHAVYHGVDSVNLLIEQMSIYRDKKGILFPQLCTLLGMVAHVPHVQEEVTEMPKLVEKLKSLQALVARKHKMEQGRQKMVARMEAMKSFNCTLPLMPPAQKKRAKVKPEWVLKKGLLSHITDPMEAIDFVLESLQITAK